HDRERCADAGSGPADRRSTRRCPAWWAAAGRTPHRSTGSLGGDFAPRHVRRSRPGRARRAGGHSAGRAATPGASPVTGPGLIGRMTFDRRDTGVHQVTCYSDESPPDMFVVVNTCSADRRWWSLADVLIASARPT